MNMEQVREFVKSVMIEEDGGRVPNEREIDDRILSMIENNIFTTYTNEYLIKKGVIKVSRVGESLVYEC